MNRFLPRPLSLACLVALNIMASLAIPSASGQSQQLVKKTIVYRKIEGHEILADVFRPRGDSARPTIVWIHGGALIMGNRESIHPQVRALAADKNYTLVSIDYRLAPETKLPEIIGDIEAAFVWLASEGAKQFHVDPDRIVVAGGSAGGYLTLVTGYRVQPRPKALVALYGYGDLIGDWYSKPSPHPRHNARKISATEAAEQSDGSVVSDAQQRKGNGGLIYQYYRQNGIWPLEISGFVRTKLSELIAPYEPLRNVSENFPPTLLIHGNNDTDVPYQQSTMMADELGRHHVPVILKTIENGEHGFAGGDARQIEDAYQTMRDFMLQYLEAR